MAALLAEPADDAVVVRPREEPIDLDAFCRRLQVREVLRRAAQVQRDGRLLVSQDRVDRAPVVRVLLHVRG